MAKNSVKIIKFSWENLRNFESVNVPLGSNKFSKNNTSLLQIQNGYGKTTTLYLLRSVFTNTPIESEYLKTGYRYRHNHTEWGGSKDSVSKFHVDLEINKEFYRLGIEIDPINESQKFTTFSEKLGGVVDGWHPPTIFRRLFEGKNEFAKLFIMDGETAKELNRSTGSVLVNYSIRQVTNLANLHLLVGSTINDGQIERVKKEFLSPELGSGGGRQATLQSALRDVEDVIKQQRKNLKVINADIEKTEKQIQKNKLNLDKMDQKMTQNDGQLERAKELLMTSQKELEKTTLNTLRMLFKPAFSYPNWLEVSKFHDSQVKAKLPRSVGRTWFREILDLDKCICGIEWDKTGDMKKHIEEHQEDYLDTRLMTYVKEVQDSVANHIIEDTLGEKITLLKEKKLAMIQRRQDVDDIRSQASEEDREAWKKLSHDQGILTSLLADQKAARDEISSEVLEFIKDGKLHSDVYNSDGSVTHQSTKFRRVNNLAGLSIVRNSILDELSKLGNAANLAKGADLTRDIISEILQNIEREIRIELEQKINKSLRGMVGAGLDGGLTIKITDEGFQYLNPNGDPQTGVNMAAELGGSYAFISALYEYAEVSIPLVLDTPLAGFGKGMAASWSSLVPETFDQVIPLINSLEMESLKGWFDDPKNDVGCYLIRRSDENIRTGKPQSGPMILDMNIDNFIQYEADVNKEGLN